MNGPEGDFARICVVCQTPYAATGKRVTCSQRCAGFLSRQNAAKTFNVLTRTGRLSSAHPNIANTPKADTRSELPPVETLPAAYVKRVHDLWVSLTENSPMRIA